MNFFINKAMGIGNSGVEHAQFYRAKCFDLVNLPYKYVFTELVKNLHEAMEAWNIPDNKVINLWELFTFGENYLYEGAEPKHRYSEDMLIDHTETHRIRKTVTSSGLLIFEHLEKSPNPKQENFLLVSDYQVEIYDYASMKRKIMFTYLDVPNRGRLISNIHLFDFEGKHHYFKNEVMLHRFFFHYLCEKFPENNTFILDRGEETEAAIFYNRPHNAKVIEMVHADHLSDRDVPEHPLWNNYYEYVLTHIDQVDHMVVATNLQREDLLVDFPNEQDKIVTIPVGGIRDINPNSKPHSEKKQAKKFVTASRLASEKHIDIVMKAIAKAREQFPDITFEIYGQGGEDGKLHEVIQELNAEDYITLKGHSHNINAVYPNYDVFISGSYSEGFGLTYIEALNAGLPIVTYKARFGAMELVEDGVNGFLKDFSRTDEAYSIEQLTEGIIQLLNTDLSSLSEKTQESVFEYQDSIIAKKWSDLINGL